MDSQRWRWRIGGTGLLVAGFVGAPLVFFEIGSIVVSALLLMGAFAGVLMLLQKQAAYSVTLLLMGLLALAGALVGLLSRGIGTLTLVYAALAIAGLTRGGQAYRAARSPET